VAEPDRCLWVKGLLSCPIGIETAQGRTHEKNWYGLCSNGNRPRTVKFEANTKEPHTGCKKARTGEEGGGGELPQKRKVGELKVMKKGNDDLYPS